MLKLFEFAILLQPKYDRDQEVVDEGRLVVPPTTVLASDEGQAQMKAVKSIPDELMEDSLDRLQVIVRPF